MGGHVRRISRNQSSNMTKVARVNATLNENPPSKYSYTVTQALQPSTKYFWKVVSRTFATDVDPTLIATSSTFSFTTGAGTGGGGGGSGPYTGSPVALPGTIEVENFDKGGSGVAYNDTTSSNQGGQVQNHGGRRYRGDLGHGRRLRHRLDGGWRVAELHRECRDGWHLHYRSARGGVRRRWHVPYRSQRCRQDRPDDYSQHRWVADMDDDF